MKEKWRHELKYTLTEMDSILTASRLSMFMQKSLASLRVVLNN